LRKALLAVLSLSVMMACEKSKVETLQVRLDRFRNILPSESRQKFDAGDYHTVAEDIDSLVQIDPEFKKSYQALKHDELIDVFSAREVVDFFREYFVEEIERLKQAEGTNW
jgi:hypothetical protein